MAVHLHCDFCVVGAGLIGSAAAKYLQSLNPYASVILVGPSEPKDRQSMDIFGSYYDESRTTRDIDKDPVWGVLNQESLRSYPDIAKQSGFEFFTRCGFCAISTTEKDNLVEAYANSAEKSGMKYSALTEHDIKSRFPYLNFPSGTVGILTENGGHINPRVLVKAEQTIARSQCCTVLDCVVESIGQAPSGLHAVRTDHGNVIHAEKVLLATGAFTENRNLLPKGFLPDMSSTTETVLFVEVSETKRRELGSMPCLASNVMLSTGTVGYILPPIRYPDGKYYIKVGHFRDHNKLLYPSEIPSWYRGDHHPDREKTKAHLLNVFERVFPDIPVVNYHFDYACTVPTSTNYPFIDMLSSTFGVAIGGCGVSAKCSDEIGKIAARMLTKGSWNYEPLPPGYFKFQKRVTAKL